MSHKKSMNKAKQKESRTTKDCSGYDKTETRNSK